MGIILHFEIPNVEHEYLGKYTSSLELGKRYFNWGEFDLKYQIDLVDSPLEFNLEHEGQMEAFKEFVKDLKTHNNYLIQNDLAFQLYNMEALDELVEFAIENRYYVKFEEW